MELIIFILATIGATFITTQSYLFNPIRNFVYTKNKHIGKLLKCSQCSGFYWGMIIKIMIQYINISHIQILDLFIYGCIGSFTSYTTYLLLAYFMEKYD